MSLDSLGVGSSCSLQPLGGRVFGSQQQQQSRAHLPLSLQVGASGRLRSPSYGNPRASAWMNLFCALDFLSLKETGLALPGSRSQPQPRDTTSSPSPSHLSYPGTLRSAPGKRRSSASEGQPLDDPHAPQLLLAVITDRRTCLRLLRLIFSPVNDVAVRVSLWRLGS